MPLQTQKLVGVDYAPISFVFIGQSMDALAARLISAGWATLLAPRLSAAIQGAFESEILDEPLTAQASLFWNS